MNTTKTGGEKESTPIALTPAPSKCRLMIMVLMLGLAYFFSNFHRLSLGVVSANLITDFSLSDTQLGLLGSALFYLYAIMQIPAGIAADRFSARMLITLSSICTAAGTLYFALAPNFTHLVISRAVTGLAGAFVYVPALTLLRKHYGDKVLGTVTGFMVCLGQLGSVSASAPLRLALAISEWRSIFRIIAIAMVVISVLIWLAIIPPPAEKKKDPIPEKAAGGTPWHLLKTGRVLSVVIWFFLAGGTRLAFQSTWGGQYFREGLSYTPGNSSVLLMCISIGCVFGGIVFGMLSDRIGSIKTLVIAGFCASVFWILLLLGPASMILSYVICFIIGLVGAGGFTVGFSSVREFVGHGKGGRLIGANNCAAFLGSAVFTQLIGFFIEGAAGNAGTQASYTTILIAFAVLCAVASLIVALLNKTLIRKKA